MKKLCFMLMLPMLFAACKKDGGSAGTQNTDTDNTLMLKLVNNIRTTGCTCGATEMPAVKPLVWNDILAATALSHSKDMEATGNFSHNSSDGTSFSARITAAGYHWTTVGENIAAGQTTIQTVFNDWLQSEDHCKNMMNASYKDFGEARAGNYWTQDFGAQ